MCVNPTLRELPHSLINRKKCQFLEGARNGTSAGTEARKMMVDFKFDAL